MESRRGRSGSMSIVGVSGWRKTNFLMWIMEGVEVEIEKETRGGRGKMEREWKYNVVWIASYKNSSIKINKKVPRSSSASEAPRPL